MVVLTLSDHTKELLAVDLLKYYWKHKRDVNYDGSRVEEALKKIEAAEPYYYKALEYLYLNNWSFVKIIVQGSLACSERTLKNKKKKMLIMLFDEVMAGKNLAISFLYNYKKKVFSQGICCLV